MKMLLMEEDYYNGNARKKLAENVRWWSENVMSSFEVQEMVLEVVMQ